MGAGITKLRTEDQLYDFEKLIEDEKKYSVYVQKIVNQQRQLATSKENIVRNIMTHFMSNSLAEKFNWTGRKSKRAFETLKSKDLIIDSIIKLKPDMEMDIIEKEIKAFFRAAKIKTEKSPKKVDSSQSDHCSQESFKRALNLQSEVSNEDELQKDVLKPSIGQNSNED